MKKHFVGVDPGLSGAIVVLDQSRHLVNYWKMPVEKIKGKNEIHISELGRIFKEVSKESLVYVEDVHSMPGQGVSSMFKFGKGFGILQGMIVAHGFTLNLVTPQKWQKFQYGLFVFDENLSPKERALIISKQSYPGHTRTFSKPGRKPGSVKYHDGLIDALLISDYGRRINSSGLQEEK